MSLLSPHIDVHPSDVLAKQEFSLFANDGGCLQSKREEINCLRVFGHFLVFEFVHYDDENIVTSHSIFLFKLTDT